MHFLHNFAFGTTYLVYLYIAGGNLLGGYFPRWQFSGRLITGWRFSGWQFSGRRFSGGIFPLGKYPRWHFAGRRFSGWQFSGWQFSGRHISGYHFLGSCILLVMVGTIIYYCKFMHPTF